MKRIIALVLCLMMILPCFSVFSSAEALDPSAPYENITRQGFAKATSVWNNDSLAKYAVDGIIDGQLRYDGRGGYQFWRPNYSGRPPYTIDDSLPQYIEIQFNDYFVYDRLEIISSRFDTLFTAQMLVLGEWVTIGTPSKEVPYTSEYVTKEFTKHNFTVCTINIPAELRDTPSKRIRIIADRPCLWEPPLVYEINTFAKKAKAPAWDVPDGAYLTTNAALSTGITITKNDDNGNFVRYEDGAGSVYASSIAKNQYPYLAANDKTDDGFWAADASTAGEWIVSEFDKLYEITEVGLNLGGISYDGVPKNYTIDVEILDKNGAWETVKTGWQVNVSSGAIANQMVSLPSDTFAKGVKFVFKSAGTAAVSEIIATIYDSPTDDSDGKCVFLADYFNTNKKESTAGGNLSCYGQAYASSSFTTYGITNPTYINDGEIADDSYSWFAATPEKDSYCGVRLRETHEVNKVVLYFNDAITEEDFLEKKFEGKRVLSFDIQANVDGEYVTIASGSSFDSSKKQYVVSFELDETIETNDVRVVFKTNGGIYPYLKELEVYEEEYVYPQFNTMTTPRYPANATSSFAGTTFPIRSPYMNINFPVLSEGPTTVAYMTINQMSALLYI